MIRNRTIHSDLDPDRVRRAAVAVSEGRTHIDPGPEPGTWRVASFTGDETYEVRTEPSRSSTCPDAQFHGTETCKHVVAVLLDRGRSA